MNLNEMLGNWSRDERNKINANWSEIIRAFADLQRQIFHLAGDEEVDNLLRQIADATQQALAAEQEALEAKQLTEQATNDAIMAKTDTELATSNAAEQANYAKEKGDYIADRQAQIDFFLDLETNLQAQINQLVVSGDSSPEAAQARVSADDTEYDTLKARLDAEHEQVTQQLAQIEEVLNGEVSILDFGADPTGVNDSTFAIQAALDYARQMIIDTQFKIPYVVVFNGGRYRITAGLINSPFVKIKIRGLCYLSVEMESGSVIHITPRVGDPEFTALFPKQQYNGGEYIEGTEGGLFIRGKGASYPVSALEIGARDNTFGLLRPTSRYGLSHISIAHVQVGLQMNAFHNYIGKFERLHIEQVGTAVQMGTELRSVQNSGENFNFHSCLFAVCDTAFDWFVDGMDCNFYACSFDFINTMFRMRRGWKNVCVFGGHVESINNYVVDYSNENNDTTPPSISFYGTVKYLNNSGIAYRGTFNCLLSGVRYERTEKQTDNFLFADEVRVSIAGAIYKQGLMVTLSPYLDMMDNGKFEKESGSTGGELQDFTITGNGINHELIVSGGRRLILTSTRESGSWKQFRTKQFKVKPGDVLEAFVDVFQNINSPRTISMSVKFLDEMGNIIESSPAYSNNFGDTSNIKQRRSVKSTGGIIAPLLARSCYLDIVFGGLVPGEELSIYQFYFGKVTNL